MRLSSTRAEGVCDKVRPRYLRRSEAHLAALAFRVVLTHARSASYAAALQRSASAWSPSRTRRVGNRSMPEAAREVGFIYGKYFLMKKLAAGGMGEIFLAKQQGPAGFQKILVVNKILSHLSENKEFIEAFLGEARLAAQMNHRNIVQVYELGEQERSHFLAMEYVQGTCRPYVTD